MLCYTFLLLDLEAVRSLFWANNNISTEKFLMVVLRIIFILQ